MRDAVPFEYRTRHVPSAYAGHTIYLVSSFHPEEVTTSQTSRHDLPELLHDASLVLESLHGSARCPPNGKPPLLCALERVGVQGQSVASSQVFANHFFVPSFHSLPLCSNASAAAACVAAPIVQRKGSNQKQNNSATQTGTTCKATHDCPLSTPQGQRRFAPRGRAAREWLLQNAQHRQEGPIRRLFKESVKMNRLIYFECRGMALIRTDSHGAHHRHTTTTASRSSSTTTSCFNS